MKNPQTNNGYRPSGFHWVKSYQSVILLTDKNIIINDWLIPLGQIEKAELLKVNIINGGMYHLKIRTKNSNFQFGLPSNSEWIEQRVLPLKLKKAELTLTFFSIFLSLVALSIFLYWLLIMHRSKTQARSYF